ncbi:MAG: metal-dependent transcriptional regulator [Oscillospiraceae bacterium]|nr:metal-dependent transcriptional regulator [Oscillospiraceae bacterium]
MKINESAETYLETILILSKAKKNQVRSIDIANELDFSKPSVSIAMKNLRASGHITVDSGGYIALSETGRRIAESMYERHMTISDWLIFLGVDREIAVNDACKMEHSMSEESFVAIKKHIEEWKISVSGNSPGSETVRK